MRIVRSKRLADAFIGRLARGAAAAKVDGQAAEQGLVGADVIGLQDAIGLLGSRARDQGGGLGMTTGIVEVDIAGGGGDQQGKRGGIADLQGVGRRGDVAITPGGDTDGIGQAGGYAGRARISALDKQLVRRRGGDRQGGRAFASLQVFAQVPGGAVAQGRRHVAVIDRSAVIGLGRMAITEVEIEPGFAVGGQVDDDDLVDRADKDLARKGAVPGREVGAGDGGIEIEAPAIAERGRQAVKIEKDVAGGAIGHFGDRFGHHGSIDQVGRFLELFVVDQGPDPGQVIGATGIVGVVGRSGPQGVFVELQAFLGDAAENHGAQAAIADGQGFDPRTRRLGVPQGEVGRPVADRRFGGRTCPHHGAG